MCSMTPLPIPMLPANRGRVACRDFLKASGRPLVRGVRGSAFTRPSRMASGFTGRMPPDHPLLTRTHEVRL